MRRPITEKLRLVTESVIDVATGVGVVGVVGDVGVLLSPPPQARSKSTALNLKIRTRQKPVTTTHS